MKEIKIYNVLLKYPLDPNVESYLFNNDVHIIGDFEYGMTEVWLASKLDRNEMLNLVDIKEILNVR